MSDQQQPPKHPEGYIGFDLAWLLNTGAVRGEPGRVQGVTFLTGVAGVHDPALVPVTFAGSFTVDLPWVGEPPANGQVVLVAQVDRARVVLGGFATAEDPPPYVPPDDVYARAYSNPFGVGSGGANTVMDWDNIIDLVNMGHPSSSVIEPSTGEEGIFRVTAYALWGDDTGGTRLCLIKHNGTELKHNYQQPSNGGQATNELTASPHLVPGDDITVEVWQNSGNIVNVQVFLDVVREVAL